MPTTNALKTPDGQSFREAVPRLAKMVSRRGLKISVKSSVPLFWADPQQDGVLIRLLAGKKTRGRIDANGRFKPLSSKK
jgi:hypothetical protein